MPSNLFEKNNPYAGNRKGKPGKTNKLLKDMIEGTLDDLGGQTWLTEQARKDPKTFIQLLMKILPKEIISDNNHTVQMTLVDLLKSIPVEPYKPKV